MTKMNHDNDILSSNNYLGISMMFLLEYWTKLTIPCTDIFSCFSRKLTS